MAVEKNIESIGMKIISNFGEILGKIVKKTKTYGDIRKDVTDAAFMATAKAIGLMQEPIREKQVKVTAEDMFEVA